MRIHSLALVALANLAATASAQCNLTLAAHGGFAGTIFLFTDSVMFDVDGTGPQAPRLVCTAYDSNGLSGPTPLGIAAFDEATGTWSPLGTGMVQGYAWRLAVLANGELVVGGGFTSIGGVACTNIARWTGSTFAPLGGGLPGAVGAMKVAPNGDLVAISGTSVQRWDGNTWTSLGAVPANPGVRTLTFAANGDILAGHLGGILRWNGSSWAAYAPGMDNVQNLATMPNGELLAAGQLATQPFGNLHFAVWNGSTWTPLGGPWGYAFGMTAITDFLFLPNGDVVAVGQYLFLPFLPIVAGVGANRWNGTAWTPVGPAGGSARTATFSPTGRLFIAFNNGLVSYQTTCPAQVAAAGNGCPGSGGANRLEVEDGAWLGGTFRSRGHGLPTLALAAAVYGFSPLALPLSAVFAEAPPGCDLLVMPDIVQFSLVVGGQATSAMPIPSNPALLGGAFGHQLNLYEFDTGGTLVSVTASNALTATVGSF